MSDKKYINLHAEIDESGKLVLVDEEGRILAGVRSKSIHTAHGEPSFANIDLILKEGGYTAFSWGKVAAPKSESFSQDEAKHLVDEINKALE